MAESQQAGVVQMSVKVDASEVRTFGSKPYAVRAVKAIGWPVRAVTAVETRFFFCYAIGTGAGLDPYTGQPFMSHRWFAELYHDRNGDDGGALLEPKRTVR